MDETYDAIVLGTGLKECILSGLLSVDGLKVLHLDRNPYYGGDSASLNLNQLYERHAPKKPAAAPAPPPAAPAPPPPPPPPPPAPEAATSTTTAEGGEGEEGAAASAAAAAPPPPPPPPPPAPPVPPAPLPPAHLGPSRDYNVDTVPKFIMGGGKLVRVLVRTKVTRYLEFKAVDGSFVFSSGRVERVPATDMEALRSPLLGLLEKRRARNFFIFVQDYKEEDPRTHGGRDLRRMPMSALYAEFGLAPATVDFVGHALALHTDDTYMNRPALDTVKRIQLYHDSLFRYEGVRSPYIYPMYGLGELPQAFARLAAVHGGTYMLNQPDAEVVFDETTGRAVGVKTAAGTAKAALAVVGDPSYFPGRCLRSSRVVRATCVLSHPLPGTGDAASCQVIVPQKQVSPPRRSDIYVFCCSATHAVAPRGRWLAFVSTTVETNDPEAELAPGLALLGAVDAKFVEVRDVLEPEDSGSSSRAFISRGYDATTHFESTVDDVLEMYTRITGKVLDLDAVDPDKASGGGDDE